MVATNLDSFCLNEVCIILFEFELVAYERGANSLPLCYQVVWNPLYDGQRIDIECLFRYLIMLEHNLESNYYTILLGIFMPSWNKITDSHVSSIFRAVF